MFASNQAGLNLLAMLGQQGPADTTSQAPREEAPHPQPQREQQQQPLPHAQTVTKPAQMAPPRGFQAAAPPQQPSRQPPPRQLPQPQHPHQRPQSSMPQAPQATIQATPTPFHHPPPAATAAAPSPANHAGMHLMAMLGVPMPVAPTAPSLPKPDTNTVDTPTTSEPKLHIDDEEETIVLIKKKPPPGVGAAAPVVAQQAVAPACRATVTVPFTPVRTADYARPRAVAAMMADVERKGYEKPLFKEAPKQRRAPAMPDGTIGFHIGRASQRLPTMYLDPTSNTGLSLTPPDHLPTPQHLPQERVRRVSDNGPNQPVGRFAPVHNNTNNARFTNNNAQSAHGHPGEGRRSFHSNNPQAMPRSPAKPKPPLAKAGMGAPLSSSLSTQNSWRVLAEAA